MSVYNMTKYLTEYFAGSDYEVIASGRRRAANVFQFMGIEYISVDITKPEEFANLPTENVYAVILLAAVIPSYYEGIFCGAVFADQYYGNLSCA